MYDTTVYVWLPDNHFGGLAKGRPGHASIDIANHYFSFGLNNEWTSYRKDCDESKYKAEPFRLSIAQELYPYVLDMYNPSPSNLYRGGNGWSYNLLCRNCSHLVANFIDAAIFPYLITIFGDRNKNTYWLNYQNSNSAIERYNLLESLYYKYNSRNDRNTIYDSRLNNSRIMKRDDEVILSDWTLYRMYVYATLHEYGANIARTKLQREYPYEFDLNYQGRKHSPDEFIWHPLRIKKYANFARAVIEYLGRQTPEVPWIYTVEWKSNGFAPRMFLPSVEEFERWDLPERRTNIGTSRF